MLAGRPTDVGRPTRDGMENDTPGPGLRRASVRAAMPAYNGAGVSVGVSLRARTARSGLKSWNPPWM